MYNLISNKQNTTKLKATKLTQGKKVLEGIIEGKKNSCSSERAKFRGQKMRAKKQGKGKGKTTNFYLPLLYLYVYIAGSGNPLFVVEICYRRSYGWSRSNGPIIFCKKGISHTNCRLK